GLRRATVDLSDHQRGRGSLGGEWPREAFRRHGVAYEVADTVRSDLYRELLPLITSQHVVLLDHPRLVAQLCGLERRTGRAGQDTIDHPPGAHDDLANAAAGALVLAARRGHAGLPMSILDLTLDNRSDAQGMDRARGASAPRPLDGAWLDHRVGHRK